jgi:hypothetical protein
MYTRKSVALVLLLAVALLSASALAANAVAANTHSRIAHAASAAVSNSPAPGDPAALTITPELLAWVPAGSFTRFTLTVSGPGDFYLQQSFDTSPFLAVKNDQGKLLPDGGYAYDLAAFAPAASGAPAPAPGDGRPEGVQPAVVQSASMSGAFSVQSGAFVLPAVEPAGAGQTVGAGIPAPQAPNDQVIADDLIVQGSGCFGFDCVDNESFGFDTIRLKENNLRIAFDDTSVSAGFPAIDWQIVANDSASGGASFLAFEDITNTRVPFKVMAGAPTNSLFVSSNGDIGVRTSTPVLDFHATTSDTPGVRLEQTNAGGFTAQTWDVAGNEANFFVRDVTGGSRLPLRIRPGAPTSSLDINAQGDIGLGTGSPAADLHLYRTMSGEPVTFRIENYAESKQWNLTLTPSGALQISEDVASVRPEFSLDGGGNLFITGALAQGSDVNSKQDFSAVDGPSVLSRLTGLPVTTWSYKADAPGVRHMGPTAQDFYAAFGLGADDTHISPLDASGVALAGVQELNKTAQAQQAQIAALQSEKQELSTRLSALEQRNAGLEARLAALEAGQGAAGAGLPAWMLLAALLLFAACTALLATMFVLWRQRA